MALPTEKRARRGAKNSTADEMTLPTDRVPPHNIDAEQALLGSCIIDGGGDILSQCLSQKIRPEYFFTTANQLIFQTLMALNTNNTAIDEITICEALRAQNILENAGGAIYVSELTNRIEVTAHAIHWIEIVREKYFLRKLISTATATVERAFQPENDLVQLLDSVEKSFFEISQDRIADSAQHIAPIMNDAVAYINELRENHGAISGIPTGFTDLDKMCFGFHPGQMIVVAARPGMGKTSIALNFIEAALFKNKRGPVPTLMFSLEMPKRELAMRLACTRSNVGLVRIREGKVGKEQIDVIAKVANEYKKAPLYIDDQGGQNILEIRAKARRAVQREKIGLIVIDYLQLINGTGNAVSREQEIAEASRSIKAMAKEFNLPVIALAQLNRKSEDEHRQPQMSDLRESGAIEQDADMILLIDYDRKGKKNTKRTEEDEREEAASGVGSRTLIVAKQRNGPTGDIKMLWRYSLTRFENAAKENQNETNS